MDDSTPSLDAPASPPDSPETSTTPDPGAAPGPGVNHVHRSAKHRILGGVAGGLGERFGLDPNLVRIGFVLLTIAWGFGILLYLAMWALIPRDATQPWTRDRDDLPVEKSSRWVNAGLLAALAVVTIIALTTFTNHPFGHGPAVGRDLFFLWIIFLAVMAAIALRSPSRGRSLRRAFAVFVLAGLSVVILVSGGILAFLASTGVPMTGGNGARIWYPTSLSDVRHSYRTEFGSMTVDLRGVKFPASGYRVVATVAIGNLTIEVPPNAVIDLHTHIGAGNLWTGRFMANGFETAGFNPNPHSLTGAALARAPHLSIDAEVGIGHINLWRGYGPVQ